MATAERDPLGAGLAGVRALVEVATLAAVGYWGYVAGDGVLASAALGLGLPLAVAAVWGLLGAPAAPYRLDRPWRLGLEAVLFGAAALALYDVAGVLPAVAFVAVAAVDAALLDRRG